MKSDGLWMAVLGSNGVGEKVSCGANSVGWGGGVGCAVDLRPVSVSQLRKRSVRRHGQAKAIDTHGHLEDARLLWCAEMEACAGQTKSQ